MPYRNLVRAAPVPRLATLEALWQTPSVVAHIDQVVTIGPQGRIVVPARVRRELGLVEGSTLAIRTDGHRVILEPRDEVLRRVRKRYVRARGGSRLSDELIADRRREARRESRR